MLFFLWICFDWAVLYVDFRFHIIQAYSKPRRKFIYSHIIQCSEDFAELLKSVVLCVPYFQFSPGSFFFLLLPTSHHHLFLSISPPFHWASAIFIMKKAQEKFPFPLSTRCYCRMVYIFYFHIFMLTYSLRSLSLFPPNHLHVALFFAPSVKNMMKGTWEIWITKLLRKARQKSCCEWMNWIGWGSGSVKQKL